MSEKQLGLDRKPVVAAVLVLLAVVVVANVMVFGPGRRPSRRPEARVQAHPAMPGDLDQMVHDTERPSLALGAAATPVLPELDRDPFEGRRWRPVTRSTRTGSAGAKRPAKGSLSCDAVVLGGTAPIAIIDGKTVRVGDVVRGYTVATIDVHGVRFESRGKERLFLPVRVIKK